MNNLEKAAEFGAVMGKLAWLLKGAGETFKYSDKVDSSPVPTKAQEDINSRSAAMQAKWAPANAATNARLKTNEAQRFAALSPEEQGAERQTKRDAYDDKIYQQLSQGHGLEGASSDFANILPAAQAAKWVGKGLYSGAKVPLGRAPLTQAPSPMASAKSFGQGAQNQAQRQYVTESDLMKTIGPTRPPPFRDIRGISGRGSIKPPTPSMPSSFDPMKTIRPNDTMPPGYTPVSIPADDAMRQWGWKFSDKPPVGKPFTKLPNQ